MGYYEVVRLLWDQVVIYLRKSRSDDASQSVEEVLQKHETQLQEYAERELGGRIPEKNIYREVVSGGESLAEREAIMAVLARCEDPNIKGVLVIEPQRLSRGSLTDCDTLMTTFELTGTFVLTPMMTYDLSRKMERKFFQDELMRGRDYLEYTKEILMRGRIAAAKRGCFVACAAPYGYKCVEVGKDHILEPVPEQADVVRLIFTMYAEGHTPLEIARHLTESGVPTAEGVAGGRLIEWHKETIRAMLRNRHYNGQIVWNEKKLTQVMEHGVVKKRRVKSAPEDVIIAPGKHVAIVSPELWEAAQTRIARSAPMNHNKEMKNAFSGVLRCAGCGRVMERTNPTTAGPRLACRSQYRCYKSVREEVLHQAVIDALENAELPALEMKLKNKDGDAVKIQERQLKALEKQMAEYLAQEETQYELLETKEYTPEVFARRNAALRKKIDVCGDQIKKVRQSMPKSVDYAERIACLKNAIDMLKDPTAKPKEVNHALKAIIEKIEYSSVEAGSGRSAYKTPAPFNIVVTLRL